MTPELANQILEVACRFDVDPHTVALLAGAIPGAREYVPDQEPKRIQRGKWSDVEQVERVQRKGGNGGWHDLEDLPDLMVSLDWLY